MILFKLNTKRRLQKALKTCKHIPTVIKLYQTLKLTINEIMILKLASYEMLTPQITLNVHCMYHFDGTLFNQNYKIS